MAGSLSARSVETPGVASGGQPPAARKPGGWRRLLPLPWLVAAAWLQLAPLSSVAGAPWPEALADALRYERELRIVETPACLELPRSALQALAGEVRCLVLAAAPAELPELYEVDAAVAPGASFVRVLGIWNLSQTPLAAERTLVTSSRFAAYTVGDGERTYRLELLDFAGDRRQELGRLARLQQAITNWQKSGHAAGFRRRTLRFDPPARAVDVRFSGEALELAADGERVTIALSEPHELVHRRFLDEQPESANRPPTLVPWAVDRLRSGIVGDQGMQLIKAIAYRVLDRVRLWLGTTPLDETDDDDSLYLGDRDGPDLASPPPAFQASSAAFPPADLEPVLARRAGVEGHWRPLTDDFILNSPGLPPTFATTFLSTDPERASARVIIVLWDPRQVELHMASGTDEPVSPTGERGDGLIPRDESLLTRLVAAFNGGFQSTHGSFGMQVGDRLYVPPLPYAATVARLVDGSTGFGTWPLASTSNGTAAQPISADLHSFRQNLTPLIGNDSFNPYGRTWWGGVPVEWQDDTRTVRTGLCATRSGFVGYFYGSAVDPRQLAMAMERAGCRYALHLDMNQGHTGLEFYRVDREARLPPLGYALEDDWQTEGEVAGLAGLHFRGRRMFKNMQLMHFPRYIRSESRDFFYLTLRHMLPGPSLSELAFDPRPGEGDWQTEGLPQSGFPMALATNELRPDPGRPETKVRLLKLDARVVKTVSKPSGGSVLLTVSLPPERSSSGTLEFGIELDEEFGLAPRGRIEPARLMAAGTLNAAPNAAFAAGIGKADHMLYLAEVVTARDAEKDGTLLEALMAALGCESTVFSSDPPIVAVAGKRDLSGHPVFPPTRSTYVERREGPGLRYLFLETPVVPRSVWQGLQQPGVTRGQHASQASPSTGNALVNSRIAH